MKLFIFFLYCLLGTQTIQSKIIFKTERIQNEIEWTYKTYLTKITVLYNAKQVNDMRPSEFLVKFELSKYSVGCPL